MADRTVPNGVVEMLLAHWLKALSSRWNRIVRGSTSRRAFAGTARRQAFWFERLEDRTLLSTLMVNSLLDNTTAGDGLVTLREAVLAANSNTATDIGQVGSGADQIVFQGGLSGEIDLTLGEMAITEDLTIVGNGMANTIVDAQLNSRIFNITGSGVDVTLDSLAFTRGGGEEDGGAIYSASSDGLLTIEDCQFTDCLTTDIPSNGGAIFSLGDVHVTGSQFTGNSTKNEGGAIFSELNVQINSSTFSGNIAGNIGGALAAGSVDMVNSSAHNNIAFSAGGAIFTNSLVLENSQLASNIALTGVGGGAIALDGATITESSVSFNQAEGPGGGLYVVGIVEVADSLFNGNISNEAPGGAIYGDEADITVTHSQFTDNSAGDNGGAIANATGLIDVSLSTFSGNEAADAGGALYGTAEIHISDSTLSGNVSGDAGGAVLLDDGVALTITSSTINSNLAKSNGGGVASVGLSASVVITNSTISLNAALEVGGAVYAQGGLVSITQATIAGNLAYGDGGGVAAVDADIFNSIIALNSTIFGSSQDLQVGTLDLQHSLIGNSSGASLTPTVGSTPDLNGNFIGGATDATAIDPLLGPLQNNGGTTFTHALLAGSLARDSGDNSLAVDVADGDAPLTTDQRGGIFVRIFGVVDMGAFEVQPLTITGTAATLSGTTNGDQFLLDLATRTVSVNGASYVLPEEITAVQFLGLAGGDLMTLDGTSGVEIVQLLATSWTLDGSVGGLTGAGNSIEQMTYNGNGGADLAIFRDSAGDDSFLFQLAQSQMSGAGFLNIANGVSSIQATASLGGNDRATLVGTAGGDTLNSNPTATVLAGAGFQVQVQFFDELFADGAGGADEAALFGSAGDDTFIAHSGGGVLRGAAYRHQVAHFEKITANGVAGADVAIFQDLPGDDTFTGRTTFSTRVGAGLNYRANNFDRVIAVSATGNDIASLFGSTGDDVFIARPTFAVLTGVGLDLHANGFDQVIANASGGDDLARLFGSTGSDSFVARPDVSSMAGAGFSLTAAGFDTVIGVAVAGGTDTAILFDSNGDDLFQGFNIIGQIVGPASTYRATAFDIVTINGTAGGLNRLSITSPLAYQLNQVGSWV